jgi:hypothetical protein
MTQRTKRFNNKRTTPKSPSLVKSRDGHVNEEYYARDDNPNFYQFQSYHFKDEEGRLYEIATDNKQIFQNKRFASSYKKTPLTYDRGILTKKKEKKKCIATTEGYIKLFVKLPSSKGAKWFFPSSLNRTFHVKERYTNTEIGFKIRSAFKYNQKRLTGTIFVSNLNKSYCNQLLNG